MDNSDTLTVNQARQQVQSEFEEYFVGNKSTSNPQRALDIYMRIKTKPLIDFTHEVLIGLMMVQSGDNSMVQGLIDKSKSFEYFVYQEEKESAFYATSREA